MPAIATLRRSNVLLALGAVAVGVASSWGAHRYIAARAAAAEARLAQQYRTQAAVVAARNLDAGASLGAGSLALRQVPARYVPSGAVEPVKAGSLGGRRLAHPLQAGDPLTWHALAPSELGRLAESLESGKRAITVPVDEVSSFSGLLAPGDVIDLLYTADAPAPGGTRVSTRPLLEAMPVVATGSLMRRQRVRGPDGQQREVDARFATVTLHVTPQEAARVVLAQRAGEITALLRPPGDLSRTLLQPIDEHTLLASASRAAVQRLRTVEYIIGGRGSTVAARAARAVPPERASRSER